MMNLRQLTIPLQRRYASSMRWYPMTAREFAPMAFYALDRPLLALQDRHRTSRTTTITLDISRVNGQLRAASSDDLEQDQVADYLVAMQQRWEEQDRGEHKKRMVAAAAKKRRSLWKKGFFEKN